MDYAKIRLGSDGDVAVITLADPATRNAVGVIAAAELAHAFDAVISGPTPARAILLTGEGRGFCSGAELTTISQGGDDLEEVYNPLVRQIAALPVPLVTAVNGAAAGVGCSFAMLGDIIVASESAFFLQAFRRIGLAPDGGASYLLARMLGKARAMEMALLGERLPAATALAWGMINRCVPDAELMPTAMAIAQELAKGPASLGLIRKTIWAALDAGLSDQLDHELDARNRVGLTEDFNEGVAAFLQKRPPVFKGH
jgi:2-(1,2-epoxy-1,2-dihydrophenyl)acetyl-CoA isomerase